MNTKRRLIRSYMVVKSAQAMAFGFISSIYTMFLLSKNLTPAQATQVNVFYMTLNFFVDLPTGALADLVGQVPVYLTGIFVLAAGFIMYGFGSSFIYFTFCESFSAVGSALMSEALEALLTNELGLVEAKKVFSKQGLYAKIVVIPAALLGSWVFVHVGLFAPWVLAGVASLVAFVYGFFSLREYRKKTSVLNGKIRLRKLRKSVKNFFAQVVLGTKTIFSTTETRLVLLVWALFAIFTQTINMFWAPIFSEQANSADWLGFVWVGISLSSGFGMRIAEKISATPKSFGKVLLCTGLPIFLIATMSTNIFVTLGLFFVHEIGRGLLPILLYVYLNRYVPDKDRSAANSARGSFRALFNALGLLVFGLMTNHMTLLGTWVIAGLGLCVFGVWLVLKKERVSELDS